MFKFNKKHLLLILVLIFLFPSFASAVSVTMDDGTIINLDGLNDTEKNNMIKYVEKMNTAKQSTLGTTAADVILEGAKDPAKLNEWRKLITGTIKDIANDLNVSVNEFVKTPVGLGVAALIFYKVAGKNIMQTVFQVVFAIPFWCMIVIVCAFTARYFLGHKDVMMEITAKPNSLTNTDLSKEVKEVIKGNEEVTIKKPIRVCRYKWKSDDARNVFGVFMLGIPIVVTVACFIIVFI